MSKAASPHVRVQRVPKRARYDCESLYRVLDRGRVAHVSFTDNGQPYCIPTLYARVGHQILIHGSSASRMIRVLSSGAPACLTVTILDGLVLARSAFEHSVNYDSAVLPGSFHAITGEEQRLAALEAFVEKLLPGRWAEARAPNRKELKATAILALAIEEASVKTRSGPPDDDASPDAELEVWAGEVPIITAYGTPRPSPGLRPGIPVPGSVEHVIEDHCVAVRQQRDVTRLRRSIGFWTAAGSLSKSAASALASGQKDWLPR
jgi:nitroimidazol reductase NimA-like FMN-containing flavoprotein (pyridoxamine 5'-phosphate oxidase superfamily)